MRRLALACLAAGAAYGVVSASAAALGVGGGGLGSGSATVATCDSDGVATTFGTVFDTTLGYAVGSVVVAGIAPACATRSVSVTLTGSGGQVLTSGGPQTVSAGGGTVTVTLPNLIATTAVAEVHTVIG